MFRCLVVVNFLLVSFLWFIPYVDYIWLTNEEIRLLDQSGLSAVILGGGIFYWFEFVIWVLLLAGMFFYLSWSRHLYLAMLIVYVFTSLLFGIQVWAPYEVAVSGVVGILDGVLIALAYFSPVSKKFQKIPENIKR